MEKISAIRGFVAMLIAFLRLLPSVGNADPHKLTCGKEKTIREAVHELKPGDTLLVSGVCNENLVIREEFHRTTIDGQGTAVINGGSSVDIGFTGTPDDRVPSPNIIQNNSRGINVQRSSVAQIGYSTITNNTTRGINILSNSHAQIGGLSDTGPSGNTISGNGRDGVRVNRTSHAEISGNTINSNGGDGIRVEENSGVNLNEANATTVNNGGRGLRCLIGAYARGSLGTLNGNAGQTSFDATCINALGQ
jgi:hypothetical protein